MWRRPTKKAEEHIDDLIEWHSKIKAHSFREHFQDNQDTGTFRSLCDEYRKLIYESTEILISLCYYCSDKPLLTRDDLEWVHDFRGFLLTVYNYFIYHDKDDSEYFDTPTRGCFLTYRQILSKTGISDINTIMIFFDKYIGYVHRFIETRKFEMITAIEYECVTSPHNGHHYKHLVELEKRDGKWELKSPVNYIGSIPRKLGDE